MKEKSELIPIMALWRHVAKSGEEYYTGKLGDASIIFFVNRDKKTEKQPDLRGYVRPAERDETKPEAKPAPARAQAPARGREPGDDDLPF